MDSFVNPNPTQTLPYAITDYISHALQQVESNLNEDSNDVELEPNAYLEPEGGDKSMENHIIVYLG